VGQRLRCQYIALPCAIPQVGYLTSTSTVVYTPYPNVPWDRLELLMLPPHAGHTRGATSLSSTCKMVQWRVTKNVCTVRATGEVHAPTIAVQHLCVWLLCFGQKHTNLAPWACAHCTSYVGTATYCTSVIPYPSYRYTIEPDEADLDTLSVPV